MVCITQLVYLFYGKEDVFHEFEQHALAMLKRYKGKLLLRCRPNKESWKAGELDKPYEVHIISFELEKHFLAFLQDEERKSFLHLKEESVKTSITIQGVQL